MPAIESGKRNIILCGFMATGKSSVGKQLASLMHYDFVDMDTEIEKETGLSIPEIFSTRGEQEFRALESEMVKTLATQKSYVIATGGGTIVNPENLKALKRNGILVALTADPETILSRVGSGEDRPMLSGGDKADRIAVLMQERAHVYAQADITIDTAALSIEEVAQSILNSLKL